MSVIVTDQTPQTVTITDSENKTVTVSEENVVTIVEKDTQNVTTTETNNIVRVADDTAQSVVVTQPSVSVVTVAVAGPQGPAGQSGAGDGFIPQYDTDPASPEAEHAWVLRTGVPVPLSYSLLHYGLTAPGGGGFTYDFKYRTLEGTTVSVALT
jgi:hypothetical protein